MYSINERENGRRIFFDEKPVLDIFTPELDIKELVDSFHYVPYDPYFSDGERYRTTSRIRITADGFELMDRKPLYQPSYVNKLNSYGSIDRNYKDVPESLLKTKAFKIMIEQWMSVIPFEIKTFSIHQIRTSGAGCPTPEGRHKDGTDWTGVFVVKRNSIADASAQTQYWDIDGKPIIEEVLPEGILINHCDKYFTHSTTELQPNLDTEPSYRDVFVITSPEHGVNKEQETYRKTVLDAKRSGSSEFA